MKTNQLLCVNFNNKQLRVESKTMLVNATDLFDIGNLMRLQSGLRPRQLQAFMTSVGTTEFIEAVSRRTLLPPDKILVAGKRSNAGTSSRFHLYLAIYAAEYLHPDFHVSVIEEFVNNRLIEWRIDGGDSFNDLRSAISTHLPDSNAQGLIIQCANRIRTRLAYIEDWNEASAEINKRRALIEGFVVNAIVAGLCTDKHSIYMAIEKCPL